jgi:hypothetical protein
MTLELAAAAYNLVRLQEAGPGHVKERRVGSGAGPVAPTGSVCGEEPVQKNRRDGLHFRRKRPVFNTSYCSARDLRSGSDRAAEFRIPGSSVQLVKPAPPKGHLAMA